ncbi:MAG TPA: 23S rRNA (adenine(2030)-N(6))-methyltransferase RlmJ [Steroidobacteraceae bacterium]|jgi:23S rRNA (adenine2030-N6)-methyltransferase|nr:23S rRNA (adenine(2030)-N(6))-methyltransferase RlmJ [Steroidobacteraceae bacterium]
MNYKHIYHAGNFADVAKHVALMYCLGALQRKDAAFFILDSHAGRGYYDLQAPEAHKSGEALRGVQRLIETSIGEALLADYFSSIRARRGKRLARYPGSPALIAGGLRPQDRALFVELMPAEARAAVREIESLGRTRTEIGDGYAALKAFLPPEERRGLVLIDPPYESLDELKLMLQAFKDAYIRWPSGIFLMWYPIRSAAQRSMVHARFEALGVPKMLFADLAIHPDDAGVGLAGSGLMIVNPPYGADEFLSGAYAAIHRGIATPGAGYVEVARLTPERMAQ